MAALQAWFTRLQRKTQREREGVRCVFTLERRGEKVGSEEESFVVAETPWKAVVCV